MWSRAMAVEVLYWTVGTLIPLTVVALHWPGLSLPRSVPLGSVCMFALAGVTAACIEEVFFRGWLQSILRPLCPAVARVPLVALLFAITHLFFHPEYIYLATFFPGLVMGILRERYDTVTPAILYHGLGNLWAIWFFPL